MGIIIFIAIILYYILKNSNYSLAIEKFQSPGFTGFVGSIIGALVGGALSLLGAYYSHWKQQEAESAIKRKNIIYTPLYNELSKVCKVLKNNKYPECFKLSIDSQSSSSYPQFTIWEEIKNDSRKFRIPKYLEQEFDNFTDSIIYYNRYKGKVNKEIIKKINKCLEEACNISCSIQEIEKVELDEIIDKQLNFKSHFITSLNPGINLTKSEIEAIKNKIYEECHQLKSIKELIKYHNNIKNQLSKLLEIISLIIHLINVKYEYDKNQYY